MSVTQEPPHLRWSWLLTNFSLSSLIDIFWDDHYTIRMNLAYFLYYAYASFRYYSCPKNCATPCLHRYGIDMDVTCITSTSPLPTELCSILSPYAWHWYVRLVHWFIRSWFTACIDPTCNQNIPTASTVLLSEQSNIVEALLYSNAFLDRLLFKSFLVL